MNNILIKIFSLNENQRRKYALAWAKSSRKPKKNMLKFRMMLKSWQNSFAKEFQVKKLVLDAFIQIVQISYCKKKTNKTNIHFIS